MKVFILIWKSVYDDKKDRTIGVFSSEEKAIEHCEKENLNLEKPMMDESYYSIDEYELDELLNTTKN